MMNAKEYELESILGTRALTPGKRYYLTQVIVGAPAIIAEAPVDKSFITTEVKSIITLEDKVVVETKNSIYTFKEAV